MRDWRYVGDGAFVGPVARRWGWGSMPVDSPDCRDGETGAQEERARMEWPL